MEHRSYQQYCGLAKALDRLGERWTLLIVRDLLLGPKRYSQLLQSLVGITTNLLAKRLKDMQSQGLIEKSERESQVRYRLTEVGAALEPALLELAGWGGRFLGPLGAEDRSDLGWALLSGKRRYRGGEEGLRVAILAGQRSFELVFQSHSLFIQEQAALAPHLLLQGQEADFFPFLYRSIKGSPVEIQELVSGSFERFGRAFQLQGLKDTATPLAPTRKTKGPSSTS